MGKYIMNQETQKIELHFDKAEYMALSDEQKKEIKSNFLWSSKAGAWVSRSTNNHYWALKVAEKLGLSDGGKVGERLSYAEELEKKSERAEARAERYETYSENAERRAVNLQSDFNRLRKDWSWLTQPIIAGHAGSRAFANHRNKVMARYERGFEEYQKSEYYQNRAATARGTASNAQLENPVYLHNRIKEQNKQVKIYQDIIVKYEDALYKIQQGEELKNRSGEVLTEAYIEQHITEMLEKYEWEHDKLEFFENKLEEVGGNRFSKDNIKVGYIVNMRRWDRCEILSAGPVNVTFKILDGGAAGGVLTDPYAAIVEILEAEEVEKAKATIENPYKVGDILCKHRPGDDSIYQSFQVVKTTATGVKLQQIAIEKGVPVADKFISDTQTQKKIVKIKWSDWMGIYMDDWQLHKYVEKAAGAV
jgi:hypothetical protein